MSGKPGVGRAWRQSRYNDSREVQCGEEKITTTITTAPTTITLNRNNKKKQHGNSSISLDSSRRTLTDRRFAPPPNSILAGYSVTLVPDTNSRSYAAPLPPSIWGPTVEWRLRVVMDTQAQDHRTRRPPLKLMVTSTAFPGPRSPFNAIDGKETVKGNGGSGGPPPDIWFSSTIKESTDRAETPEEDTRRNNSNERLPGLVLPKRGTGS
jgi:hypothetical protein